MILPLYSSLFCIAYLLFLLLALLVIFTWYVLEGLMSSKNDKYLCCSFSLLLSWCGTHTLSLSFFLSFSVSYTHIIDEQCIRKGRMRGNNPGKGPSPEGQFRRAENSNKDSLIELSVVLIRIELILYSINEKSYY